MNKKIIVAVVSLSLLSTSFLTVSAENFTYDANNDSIVDCFDMALMRKTDDVSPIRDFLLNKSDWNLVWNEEFEGTELDSSKWSYEMGNWLLDSKGNYETSGWGNNEQQFYTDQNTIISDGTLKIQAKKESYTDPVQGSYEYTSSKLITKNKFSVCGGKIEVRARVDSGKSLWPAIWMLPEDTVYGKWAASGEIDIMEGWGSTPQKICGTIHFGDVWPNNSYLTNDYYFPENDSTENWHTYSLEWEKDCMRWYVDEKLFSTQTDWYSNGRSYPAPFDQNFYLILNLAVGGHFDGVDGIYADPTIFENGPKQMEVDYVRVYKKNGEAFTPTKIPCESLKTYIEDGSASLANSDNGCTVNIANVGSKEYSVMGILENRSTVRGKTYCLDFTISSTAEREMVVTAENSIYNRFIDEKITVSSEPIHYHYEFTPDEDLILDIKFQLGNIGSASQIGEHTVLISDIKWTEKG